MATFRSGFIYVSPAEVSSTYVLQIGAHQVSFGSRDQTVTVPVELANTLVLRRQALATGAVCWFYGIVHADGMSVSLSSSLSDQTIIPAPTVFSLTGEPTSADIAAICGDALVATVGLVGRN